MNFGARLTELRKAAGYTHVEFAQEVGISQRMVAYYESPEAHPSAHLLPDMARVLGVSTDELLGLAPVKRAKKVGSSDWNASGIRAMESGLRLKPCQGGRRKNNSACRLLHFIVKLTRKRCSPRSQGYPPWVSFRSSASRQ